ncbi:MAG TPA: sigma-70 family RNA polymerase sigma factor [Phycisphaerae bacterium]|nr:sigma-70 family RNA polymerase sigma factor [Phycisphaerae bacterium]
MRSDAELVAETLDGDRQVFADLVRRYERPVRAIARGILGDHHAAQDAAQETFVLAYRKLHALRKPAAFGPWVMKIARNQALRMARRARPVSELPPDQAAPGGDGDLNETSRRLLSAVTALPAHERAVVLLRHFDGRTVREVADITGRSVGTVTKQLSRAYERLRRRLGGTRQ